MRIFKALAIQATRSGDPWEAGTQWGEPPGAAWFTGPPDCVWHRKGRPGIPQAGLLGWEDRAQSPETPRQQRGKRYRRKPQRPSERPRMFRVPGGTWCEEVTRRWGEPSEQTSEQCLKPTQGKQCCSHQSDRKNLTHRAVGRTVGQLRLSRE